MTQMSSTLVDLLKSSIKKQKKRSLKRFFFNQIFKNRHFLERLTISITFERNLKDMKKLAVFILGIVLSLSSEAQTKVKFYTTLGEFVLVLEDSLAPITSGNFKTLVSENYYDGVSFHRVINNFMIQGGRGANKPNIQDEFHDSLSNVQGTISMANTGAANSGNTQFFINLVNNTGLDYNKAPLSSKHPVFGHVIENFSVVQAIGSAPVNGSAPNPPIYMDSLRIMKTEPTDTNNSNDSSAATLIAGNISSSNALLNCFPNPVTAQSVIKITTQSNKATLRIIDLFGKEIAVKQFTESVTAAIPFYEVAEVDLPSGVYLLEIVDNNQRQTQHILVE